MTPYMNGPRHVYINPLHPPRFLGNGITVPRRISSSQSSWVPLQTTSWAPSAWTARSLAMDGWNVFFLGQNDLKMWVIWGNGHFQWARWGNDHVGWKKIFSNGLDCEIFVQGKHTCQYGYFSQIQVVTNDLLFLDFMAIVLIIWKCGLGSNMASGKPTDDPSFLSLWFLASLNSTLGSKGYGLEWVLPCR